jgi:hypothetical protein
MEFWRWTTTLNGTPKIRLSWGFSGGQHPPCTERQSLNKECGWKGGDRGGLANGDNLKKETTKKRKKTKGKT